MDQQTLVLKITETKGEIERKMKDALKKRFANKFVLQKAMYESNIRLQGLFRVNMYRSATYQSLSTNGTLVGELGLEDAQAKIDAIIEKWVSSTKTTLSIVKGGGLGIKGGFKIQMVRSNYAEVLRMAEAKQLATSKRAKSNQTLMRWLDWLLLRGDKKIIIGYESFWRPNISGSRTGLAIMFKSKGARSWNVPVQFSGTEDNNFVTEVLKDMEKDIILIFKRALGKAARR